jgi:uncharacterized membrane protein
VQSLRTVLDSMEDVADANAVWMTWNLFLAAIPAGLAVLVFRHRGGRGPLWWVGLGLFTLFLPNAPYLVTDLVHLRADVVRAGGDTAVVTGVVPVYAAVIGLGMLAYTFSLIELGRYLDRVGLASRRVAVELGVHLLAAVGVVLGRFARLNSWEPMTEPHGTLERIVLTLSARWAVPAVAAMFLVCWVGHAATRAVVDAAARTLRSLAALGGVTARS